MKNPAGILVLILITGCYRADSRRLVVDLPETAGRPAELATIKQALWSEQERVKNGIVFYDEIKVDAENARLEIIYNREYLADMNVLGKIHALGYSVNGLPGDPALLAKTRGKLALP